MKLFLSNFNFFKKNVSKKNFAQGTIEYLLIIGIVVVIALVVVGLLVNISSENNVDVDSSKIYWSTQNLALLEGVVDEDGNWVLAIKNNDLDKIYLDSIEVDEKKFDLNSYLLNGFETKTFLFINNYLISSCNANSKPLNLTLNYTSKNGLNKTIKGKREFVFNCVEDVTRSDDYVVFGENEVDEGNGEVNLGDAAFEIILQGSNDINYSSSKIDFSFYIEDFESINTCSLIINNEIVLTHDNSSFDFNSLNTFSHSFFTNGNYLWDINCTDNSENIIGSNNGPFNFNLTRDFTQISTCSELQDMNLDLTANYVLINDIDCLTDTNTISGALYNGGLGFSPIGNSSNNFLGTFDGAGYTITGLHINKTTDYIGLFGYLGTNSIVVNVDINEAYIYGNKYVGGLAGYSRGYISNVSFNGLVNGTDDSVGGLVGYLRSGSVLYSSSEGSVFGEKDVGGLFGGSSSSYYAYVSDCFSLASVSSVSGYSGGIVGDCYSVDFDRVFFKGVVSFESGSGVGGVVGYDSSCYFSSSFVDLVGSGVGDSGDDSIVELFSSEFESDVNFVGRGWDFDRVWVMGDSSPVLRESNVYLGAPSVAGFSGGSGSLEDPFVVSSCGELQLVGSFLDANFVLVSDVDCSDSRYWNKGRGFVPIGGSGENFVGSFDGNGNTITNLFVNDSFGEGVGLFGYAGSGSSVVNLSLVDASVFGEKYVGGLVGYFKGSISNCSFDGLVVGSTFITSGYGVGGLVGYLYSGNIAFSSSSGSVFGEKDVGGLFGGSSSSYHGYVSDCFSLASVSSVSGYSGGIVGDCYSVDFDRVFFKGVVSFESGSSVGGVVGYDSYCYFSSSFVDLVGSGVDDSGDDSIVELSSGEFESDVNFVGRGWDFDNVWVMGDSSPVLRESNVYLGAPSVAGFSGGSGSLEDPFVVSSCGELQLVGSYLDANFVLGNDIDCSDTKYWNKGRGFVPIGGSGENFVGSFDGNGNTITNLFVNDSFGEGVGLFGYAGSGSSVVNLSLVDASVFGEEDVGGLVGYFKGSISNCSFDGLVVGSTFTTSSFGVGGLVGYLNSGSIAFSSSSGSVFGGERVGGLVGDSSGSAYGYVSDCFSVMDVSATSARVGGLVGYCTYLYLDKTFSKGVVGSSSSSYVNGFMGQKFNSCFVSSSFVDLVGSGQASAGHDDVVVLASGDFGSDVNFVGRGWDFDNVWVEGVSLPLLRDFDVYLGSPSVASFSGGNGSLDDPYVVSSCSELQLVGSYLDANFVLADNLDCSETKFWNRGRGFSPIGNSSVSFDGSFDGGGNVISGLFVNRPFNTSVGLFGYTGSGSSVVNMHVVDGSVFGRGEVGGLVGYSKGDISGCSFDGLVVGYTSATATANSVGGLVGYLHSGRVSFCSSSGSVFGKSYVGGLVGDSSGSYYGYVSDCFSVMDVSATSARVGGLVGYCTYLYLDKTFSKGVVGSSSSSYVNGFMGQKFNSCFVSSSFVDLVGSGQASAGHDDVVVLASGDFGSDVNFVGRGWDFDNVWVEGVSLPLLRDFDVYLGSPSVASFSGGNGSLDDPYVVSSCSELQLVGSYLDANFVLADNLDCSETKFWNRGRGFSPIGNSSVSFDGSFDGGGNVISGLFVNRPFNTSVGLFGYTGSGSSVVNMHVVDGSVFGRGEVGGLVGYSKGDISGCSFDGLVVGYTSATATANSVGGLVGYLHSGRVSFCSSSGSVFGKSYVGGLVGDSSGSYYGYVSDCFSVMDVSATSARVGGLVGYCTYLYLDKTFSKGVVGSSSSSYVNGFMGQKFNSCFVSSSFVDLVGSGQASAGHLDVVVLLPIEFSSDVNFVNSDWNFDSIWIINEGDSYPYLRSFIE